VLRGNDWTCDSVETSHTPEWCGHSGQTGQGQGQVKVGPKNHVKITSTRGSN